MPPWLNQIKLHGDLCHTELYVNETQFDFIPLNHARVAQQQEGRQGGIPLIKYFDNVT